MFCKRSVNGDLFNTRRRIPNYRRLRRIKLLIMTHERFEVGIVF